MAIINLTQPETNANSLYPGFTPGGASANVVNRPFFETAGTFVGAREIGVASDQLFQGWGDSTR